MHSECSSPGELPEAKCICRLCKEGQLQPVTKSYTAEIQTREASEETVDLVEATIQTDADMVTEEHTDLSELAPGQKGASGQDEATTDKETPMVLGKSASCTLMHLVCAPWQIENTFSLSLILSNCST